MIITMSIGLFFTITFVFEKYNMYKNNNKKKH